MKLVNVANPASADAKIERRFSDPAYVSDPVPQRDERFPDPYNMGVHAEAFLYDESFPPEPKTLMMYFKRLREIDVPEMMASIIVETPGKPWDYTVDMTRPLWDEARHAMMGEVGFVQAGIDWRQYVRVNFTWSKALNAQLQPLERHAVLYFIEQGLMPKTGKRFEWEVGIASGEGYAALISSSSSLETQWATLPWQLGHSQGPDTPPVRVRARRGARCGAADRCFARRATSKKWTPWLSASPVLQFQNQCPLEGNE